MTRTSNNNERGPAAAALLLLLLGTATAVTATKPSSPLTRTIEILSSPIVLKYGQVNNRYQEPISLPEDVVAQFANNKTMAIVDYKVDIVDEAGNQVPLYDIYNHHYGILLGSHDFAEGVYNFTKDAPYGVPPPKDLVGWVNENASFSQPDEYFRNEGRRLMMMTSMMSMSSSLDDFDFSAGFGGGSGAEERGTSHKLPDGYAWMIHQPEAMTALFHLINTRAPPSLPQDQLEEGETSKLLECPCTPQRVIDVANVSVDGVSPFPPFGTCNAQLMQDNPSCQISTYRGGWRCCEDGVFVIDTDEVDTADLPEDTVYGKLILTYLDGDAEDMELKNARGGAFDATGSLDTRGNVEFDVPQVTSSSLLSSLLFSSLLSLSLSLSWISPLTSLSLPSLSFSLTVRGGNLA